MSEYLPLSVGLRNLLLSCGPEMVDAIALDCISEMLNSDGDLQGYSACTVCNGLLHDVSLYSAIYYCQMPSENFMLLHSSVVEAKILWPRPRSIP